MEFGKHGQAARDALNAQVPPVNLNGYETAPVSRSAGVLAGAPVVNRCVPGAGRAAAADLADVCPSVLTAGLACFELTGDQLGDLATDLLEITDRAERSWCSSWRMRSAGACSPPPVRGPRPSG